MMLTRLNPGRVLGSPERGAVSSIVAILFAGGVVFGLGALTVDVGSMMWERRQVQNGADAAAATLPSACANAESNCRSNLPAIQQLDDSNASDSHSSADGVCGR